MPFWMKYRARKSLRGRAGHRGKGDGGRRLEGSEREERMEGGGRHKFITKKNRKHTFIPNSQEMFLALIHPTLFDSWKLN